MVFLPVEDNNVIVRNRPPTVLTLRNQLGPVPTLLYSFLRPSSYFRLRSETESDFPSTTADVLPLFLTLSSPTDGEFQ